MRSNLVKLMAGPSPESEAEGDVKNGGDNAGDEKRRRLIVDLELPRFDRFTGLLDVPGTLIGWVDRTRYGASTGVNGGTNSSQHQVKRGRALAGEKVSSSGDGGPRGSTTGSDDRDRRNRQELETVYRTALNEDQRAAVRKLVTAKDYALLLGMPGTGKACVDGPFCPMRQGCPADIRLFSGSGSGSGFRLSITVSGCYST